MIDDVRLGPRPLLDLLEPQGLDLPSGSAGDVHRFRGDPQHVNHPLRLFGGLVVGQAVSCAARTVPSHMQVHSFHCSFLRAGDARLGTDFTVEPLRDSRATAVRRVVAEQEGRTVVSAMVSAHAWEPGPEHQQAMPTTPGPEDCPDAHDVLIAMSTELADIYAWRWADLEVRYVAETARHSPTIVPSQWWIRSRHPVADEPGLHVAVLAYASDLTLLSAALLQHQFSFTTPGLTSASLDHGIWAHRRFAPDDWLLFSQRSPAAAGARSLSLGSVFTQEGVLVATVAQEGLIRTR